MEISRMKLSEVKSKTLVEVVRDGDFQSLGSITENKPQQLAFIENVKDIPKQLETSSITCIITLKDLVSSIPQELGLGVSDNPRKTFYEIHNYLAKETNFYWKNFKTQISSSAKIHPTVYVAERNVRIGDDCMIEPNASILENSILGNNVVVRVGTVVGTEGFEFERIERQIMPVVHAGGVLIHSRVEIQANCCIAKGVFGDFTELDEDTKINNLVHIGHNVRIGKRCMIGALATVSGSTSIGDDVWIGPSASISSEIRVGDGAFVTIGSVVTKDVASGQRVTGNFAIDHEKFIAFIKSIR